MDIEAFISSVFVKNPLWDQKDSQHHNRFILDKLWDAVADEMKSTRNVVRAKWKTLRDTFRKELKKMPVKRSGDGASQCTWKSSWQYFESLYFLKDLFTARSSTGNLPDVEGDNIVDEDTNFQLAESNMRDSDYSVNVDQSPLINNELKEKSNKLTSTPARKELKRKQQNEDVSTALIRIEENKLRILEKQHNKSSDEDESFFESLLPHIRTLTPQNKMLLRMKMQELVYNFAYGNQQPNQHMSTPRAPSVQNICNEYQINPTQFTLLHTSTQEYSNPTSVASYLSNFSDETNQNM